MSPGDVLRMKRVDYQVHVAKMRATLAAMKPER